jgi:mono/diheme cytochrome c family protein
VATTPHSDSPVRTSRRGRHVPCWLALVVPLVILAAVAAWAYARFGVDRPVVYDDPQDHFKYGSTGGERQAGFPYWIWRVLPTVCEEYLPGEGYASLGMIYEPGHDLPVGMSKRRVTGLDRVFLNCAVCHTSTVRDAPGAPPRVIPGMPANTMDLMGFEKFFFDCAADARFSPSYIIPAIEAAGGDLDLVDHYLVYPLAVLLMRDQVMTLRKRFDFVNRQPAWGPGRVDTFNSAKVIFNFPLDRADPAELIGTVDFPSIWNQRSREGMQLHWDGNNTKVEERNRSAAFGTGATPSTLDRASIHRMEAWLRDAAPPPWPYAIDQAAAGRGAAIYREYCANCHGVSGKDFSGEYVGTVVPIDEIGTDRHRLDSYTRTLAVNQGLLYAGYGDERFSHFRKTHGYASMPLDGVWLRAPYLHNGSVPTLRDLLEPAADRPARFYRGDDVYDPVKVGFVSDVAAQDGRTFFLYDTAVAGNGNQGHEGPAYGTDLPAADKDALVEFLKTF